MENHSPRAILTSVSLVKDTLATEQARKAEGPSTITHGCDGVRAGQASTLLKDRETPTPKKARHSSFVFSEQMCLSCQQFLHLYGDPKSFKTIGFAQVSLAPPSFSIPVAEAMAPDVELYTCSPAPGDSRVGPLPAPTHIDYEQRVESRYSRVFPSPPPRTEYEPWALIPWGVTYFQPTCLKC